MAGFYVGHGRHWDFLRQAGLSDGALMALFYQTLVANAQQPIATVGSWSLLAETTPDLTIAVLMNKHQLSSAFPYTAGGHIWPMTVHDRYDWQAPNNEAQLIGACHGAAVTWFDTHYAFNKDAYGDPAKPILFAMSALGYQVWPTQFANDEQAQLMRDMKAYMPLTDQGEFIASADEFQFVSHVEAVRTFNFHGTTMHVFTVTLALPEDFPMRLDVFTPVSAVQGTFDVGDCISGVCWLLGHLAT